jgi:hypothetical protein
MMRREAGVSATLTLTLSIATALSCRAVAQTADPSIQPVDSLGAVKQLWREQRASGIWRSNYYRSSKELDEQTDIFGAALQLKAFPSLNERLDGKLEVRVANSAVGKGAATRASVLEGYATVRFDKADLRLGKQIVPWGRADGVNPTDNLTPRDYTVLLPFEDDQRFGTTGVKLDIFISREHTLTFFVTPAFEPARAPLPSAAGKVERREPAHTLANTHGGARLNKVGEGFDWSVSYFRGFSLAPGVELVENEMALTTLRLHYDRITAVGADFARNYGRFGLRGEVALVDTADDRGSSPRIRNPHVHWIVGVDRTFFANLNANLQFFERRVRKHRDPATWAPAQRTTAMLNSLIDGQSDAITHGISFRVSNKWFNDTLEAEVFAVHNLTRGDGLLRPLVTYAFNDRWKGTLGAEIYRGSSATQYGSLKANRGAFAELRYGF